MALDSSRLDGAAAMATSGASAIALESGPLSMLLEACLSTTPSVIYRVEDHRAGLGCANDS